MRNPRMEAEARGGSSSPTRTSPRHRAVQATQKDGNVNPVQAARKRAAHKVREQADNDKRQKDPNAAYSDPDETDSEVEERHKTKKKARTRKEDDTVDLTNAHKGAFDIKLAEKKAHEVAACDRAILAPNWTPDDSMEQKQKKVYEFFFAHNLNLQLKTANRAFLNAKFKPNSGNRCAELPRGKILENAYLMFGKACWANMTSLIVMSLGWADFSSVNAWTSDFLPATVTAIQELVPPPIDLFKVAASMTRPEVPSRNEVKDACSVAVYTSMKAHVAFLRLLKLKHREGRVLKTETSLRRQPELFGKFALMAVLSCSGANIGVVTKRATDLASGNRTFGKFNLPHYT